MNAADRARFVDPTLETMPREDLAAYQWQRFARLVPSVAARNPFYRAKWRAAGVDGARAIGDWKAFRRLPFTTKAELSRDQEAHPPYGSDLTFPLERYLRVHQT